MECLYVSYIAKVKKGIVHRYILYVCKYKSSTTIPMCCLSISQSGFIEGEMDESNICQSPVNRPHYEKLFVIYWQQNEMSLTKCYNSLSGKTQSHNVGT